MISFFNTKTRLLVALLSVFIIGGALGFIGGQAYQRMLISRMQKQREMERNQNPPGNPNDNQNRMLDNLQKELQLTAEQRQKIDTILQQRRGLFRKDMQEIREKMRQVRDETDQQIQNVLTPEQKQKFLEIRKEREQHQRMGAPEGQRRGDNPEPPPPPPGMNNGSDSQRMNRRDPMQRPGEGIEAPVPSRGMNNNPGDRPQGRRDQFQRRPITVDSTNVSNDTSANKQSKQSFPRRRFIHEEN